MAPGVQPLSITVIISTVISTVSDLADGCGQQVNNALVRHSDHAVTVDFNDTMTDPHSAALTDPTSQQTTYLHTINAGRITQTSQHHID